jgi:hypothetical protein
MLRPEEGGQAWVDLNGNLQIAQLTSVAIDPQPAPERLGPFYDFPSSRLRAAQSEPIFLLPSTSDQRDLFLASSADPASVDHALHLTVKLRGNQGLPDTLR